MVTTLFYSLRMGHFWRMTLPFNNDGGTTSEPRICGDRRHHPVHFVASRENIASYPAKPGWCPTCYNGNENHNKTNGPDLQKRSSLVVRTLVRQGCVIAPTLFKIYATSSFLSVTVFRVELKLTTGSMGDFKLSHLNAKTRSDEDCRCMLITVPFLSTQQKRFRKA